MVAKPKAGMRRHCGGKARLKPKNAAPKTPKLRASHELDEPVRRLARKRLLTAACILGTDLIVVFISAAKALLRSRTRDSNY